MKRFATNKLFNLGIGLAVLILLIVVLFASSELSTLLKNNNLVSHTLSVLNKLSDTLSVLTDAETGQRGYLITGNEVFLKPYNAAVSTNDGVNQDLQDLRQLTSDNPDQLKYLDSLEILVAEKLKLLGATIEMYRTSGFAAAQQAVESLAGKQAMDEIRLVIAEMQNMEKELLQQRSDNASSSLRNTVTIMGFGVVLAVILLISSAFLINREISERRRVEEALKQLNSELDQRVEQRTSALKASDRKRRKVERHAREIVERASQAKSEFLSRMSHELRTPLNSILGFSQLLQMDELTPDQKGSVEQILKSGHHLLDLINEVLDITRIESGRMEISSEPVQLEEALNAAVDLIRPLADKRGISIQIKTPSSKDVFVNADNQRLKQVLLNLLSNAVKYNREGGEIHVTASLLMDGFLHLAVRDSGPGIPPEKMERLFIPFDRLELDPNLVEGTGLGLALSKGLVEAMGGRIGAQSVVGQGSTFWLDLQLTSQQKEAIVMAEVDDYLKSNPAAKKGMVLYVEDNLSNIQLMERILARLPEVNLVTAMQGHMAMDLARLHKPGLILLDLNLPDMNGSEVLKLLRADPATTEIPIVIMSADATTGQIERMLAAGANAYLTKPIDIKEFLKVVGDILQS
jgi:signal transduction histidine kinase/CheY-like chemotaxis protein